MDGTDDTALVVDFLNTLDLETGTDVLASRDAYLSWAAARGLRPGDRGTAIAVRAALRARVEHRGDAAEPALPQSQVEVVLDADGPRVASSDVVAAVLGAGLRLAATGVWERIKICPGDDCGEAFLDTSRNRSRTWCDMAVCGNVAKARTYRRRRSSAS